MKLYLLILCLACTGCTKTVESPACSILMSDKRDLVGQETHETNCNCTCPAARSNIFEFGGVVGGLANLFNK